MIDIVRYLPTHSTERYKTRSLALVDMIVIHHSADEGDPLSWARYHVGNHGWPGIGYHAAVMRDGTVLKTNNDSTMSYHAGDANATSFGIVLQGDLSKTGPTTAQLASALLTVKRYADAYSIKRIVGHGDVMQTSCPGATWLVEWIKRGLNA